ncbi:hypothetical protein [Pseudonocardia charpentierae]|uniref:DUF4129 domain-containing protein n=1 Tax=Pseudonocardia charpentierae TaxID=3075545 RepID=A0ABU2NI14_9PSEU|nr:hypothetical protein [Pseudonocardia sp. DSM 45834]MDT0353601.1 hypothetical protein [Pseudonocardia sp. DSM 45834]
MSESWAPTAPGVALVDSQGSRTRLLAEFAVALVATLVGGALSLAGVAWQFADADRHVQRQAVEKFLDEYTLAQVELQYYGERRVPARSLSADDEAAARKQVHSVYGACARLVLVAPELAPPAVKTRDLLSAWEKALSGPHPYGRSDHESFVSQFETALSDFLTQAKARLDLP